MKKYLYLALVISLLPKIANGQIVGQNIAQKEEHSTYYSTDRTTIAGIVLVEGNDIENSMFCKIKEGEKVIYYTPYEVKEYRFKDGRTYKSFPVKIDDTISRYFLERLVKGNTNLFCLITKSGVKKYYLAEGENSNVLEIPLLKEEYSALFDSVFKGCPQVVRNIPFIKIQKYYLIRFIQDYNKCAERQFPRLHYGFSTGVSITQISVVQKLSLYFIPKYNNDWTTSIGVFIDIPIRVSNLSFHPEINYKQYGFSQSFTDAVSRYDLVINNSSIRFPFLVRYSLLSKKISPYFQIGPTYCLAIKNEGDLFQYNTIKNSTYINVINSPILQENMGGFSIGSGIILNCGSKYAWFVDLSYSKFYNLEKRNRLLNLSEFSFKIGLIF